MRCPCSSPTYVTPPVAHKSLLSPPTDGAKLRLHRCQPFRTSHMYRAHILVPTVPQYFRYFKLTTLRCSGPCSMTILLSYLSTIKPHTTVHTTGTSLGGRKQSIAFAGFLYIFLFIALCRTQAKNAFSNSPSDMSGNWLYFFF